jgi:hypothetical protein
MQIRLASVSALVLLLLASCGESKFSNCVTVEEESDYTGTWLQHDKGNRATLETPECEKKDFEIDNGDGPKHGKVRWAVCLNGPDCDEAGNF